jgi:hypothetical protein
MAVAFGLEIERDILDSPSHVWFPTPCIMSGCFKLVI